MAQVHYFTIVQSQQPHYRWLVANGVLSITLSDRHMRRVSLAAVFIIIWPIFMGTEGMSH